MLSDLDAALKNYLQNETIPGQSVQVALDPPTKDWAARRTGAVLNLFLADIREDVDRRDVNLREITNDQGVVVARQQANRFYLVTYLLTAWTSTPEDDHRLLGLALVAMLRQDYLPFEYVTGDLSGLVGAGFPLTTRVGLRAMNERVSATSFYHHFDAGTDRYARSGWAPANSSPCCQYRRYPIWCLDDRSRSGSRRSRCWISNSNSTHK